MAELADALDSGSNGRKAVQVQVLLPAPKKAAALIGGRLLFLVFGVIRSQKRHRNCRVTAKSAKNVRAI